MTPEFNYYKRDKLNMDSNLLVKKWSNPDKEFRSAPFWAWNSKLTEVELRRQIRLFKSMGVGGFFMHSRVGLDTPYLSDEWFNMINACIDEAKKCNLNAWLYDEDRWPSGAAGGLVTKHPEFRMKLIYLYEISKEDVKQYKLPDNIIALFAAKVAGIKAKDVRKVKYNNYQTLKKGETLIVFTLQYAPNTSWYNGYCYIDPMNKTAVKKFIEVTHEAYKSNCGDYFGKTVPGIFSDEPQMGFVTTVLEWANDTHYSTPYNEEIKKIILERYNYNLFDHLVEIFFDVEDIDFSRARVDYIGVMSELFIDSYAKQIGAWSSDNKLIFTGHVMGEDSLAVQSWTTGSAMRFYEYMQMPGLDQLGEHQRCFSAAKQVSSVANQFGQQRRLTETYGCTGWDFPLMGHKALGDWQLALGINFRCQHLALYTMEAEAKRDYPASISYQSQWHKEYKNIEDYFARLCAVLSEGKEVKDILLITPIESAWAFIRKDFMKQDDTKTFEQKFLDIQNTLMTNSFDFDFGDEDIISRFGKVNHKTNDFVVNMASYKVVIVPEMRTIRSSTLALLEEFVDAGGVVIQAGSCADFVDCRSDNCHVKLSEKFKKSSCKDLANHLEIFRRISFFSENNPVKSILSLIKKDKKNDYIFAVNLGHDIDQKFNSDVLWVPSVVDRKLSHRKVKINYRTDRIGRVYEFDTITGEISLCNAKRTGKYYQIESSFYALSSRLFIITSEEIPVNQHKDSTNNLKLKLPAKYKVDLSENNNLVIDHFQYKIGDGDFSNDFMFVMTLDDKLKDLINLPPRSGMIIQPWVGKLPMSKTLTLTLRASVYCQNVPKDNVYLALESPQRYKIRINGKNISKRYAGFFIDRSLKKIKINHKLLRKGENLVELSCQYDASHKGLEAIFLLGNFGVMLDCKNNNGIIDKPVKFLKKGDWTTQGLAFYSGNVDYIAKINRKNNKGSILKINDYKGSLLQVFIDSKVIKTFIVPPYTVDLGKHIKNKDYFELRIRVFGSPRNSHGPFFLNEKSPDWCGPDHFKLYQQPKRQLVQCGIMA